MEFTRDTVEARAGDYAEREPLYAVEREHVSDLPAAFASGEFSWRDAEWVVRWYFRRFLGAYPDAERRATEEAFQENDYNEIQRAVRAAIETDNPDAAVEHLTTLAAVDIRVASAFLLFIDPERYMVLGEREWSVLHRESVLVDPYPASPSVSDYQTYVAACRDLADRLDCDMWTLYRALWWTWKDQEG